jgi:hypothetical protein
MLIYLKVYMERLKFGTFWNPKNCGFSICTRSTTGWIGWNNYVVTIVGSIMETIGSVDITSSILMLSIT